MTATVTSIPGSSSLLWGGVAAYSNECKSRLLGVSPEILAKHGAVSREVARAMAEGILAASGADVALAITGIAGPDGGSPEKPVGLVWFSLRAKDGSGREESAVFPGDRAAVRSAAAVHAMLGAAEIARGFRA